VNRNLFPKTCQAKTVSRKKVENCFKSLLKDFCQTSQNEYGGGIAGNVQGLLLRWHSMDFSPERQHNNEPKAEDNYKSRTMNFQPGTAA
jgi:peptide deformylase